MQGNVILFALARIQKKTFIFKDTIINNSKEEKILDVTIDNKLIFSSHISKNASQKISALSRI